MAETTSLPTYSAIYAFGDSLSDSGNLSITTSLTGTTPVSPPYFRENYGALSGNVFSNGPTWVQDLSIALGLGTLAPSLAGGTNFAYGGAETGSTPQNTDDPEILAISLPTQLAQFQAEVPKPSANALYTLSIGANDLLEILDGPTLTAAQQTADINASVANEISFVNQLIAKGAKTILVLNVPDLGKTPDVTSGQVNGSNVGSPALTQEASQLSSEYDTTLVTQLAAIDATGKANVQVVNSYQLIDNAVADPAEYGLTNVTSGVWSGSYTSDSSGTLAAVGATAQDQYLFWDHLHPTETGHQAIADAAETILDGAPVLTVDDNTTGQPLAVEGHPYTGPVAGLVQQYTAATNDNLSITATTPDWFILGGSGENAITVTSGTNVLDGGSGSSFLTGGSGTDTFYIDARGETANEWSTAVDFHTGDSLTVWGVSPSDFTLSWFNGLGAAGYTGLTLLATEAGKPETVVTLAGFTEADLSNGRLSVTYGTETTSGSAYTTIHVNA